MNNLNRRNFIKSGLSLGAAGLATNFLTACASLNRQSAKTIGRVVIIGGGYGGLTAAKYLRIWSAGNIEVVVIEKSSQFVSCPLSNLVLGGSKTINDLTFGYDLAQKNHGITWVTDEVIAIDAANKKVTMKRGEVNYDRLIIAPGVDMMYDAMPNLEAVQQELDAQQRQRLQAVDGRA